MLESFQNLGLDVVPVTGPSPQRKAAIAKLKLDHSQGIEIVGAYSESLTSPTMFSDPDHLPRHPLMDPLFFRWLGLVGAKRGLFYRDIHWRFPLYRNAVKPHVRWPAYAGYHFDVAWYRRYLDALFLPGDGMAEVMPGKPMPNAIALPPGGQSSASIARETSRSLRLLYVGGATPPLYDLAPLLEGVRRVKADVTLTLCCPLSDHSRLKAQTAGESRFKIIRSGSNEVADLYRDADIACVVYAPHDYRDFAMPIKLFEAIGHGIPVLASAPTSVSSFVARDNLGWLVEGSSDLATLLKRLTNRPDEVAAAAARVRVAQSRHTWDARAQQVLDSLGITSP